MLCVLLLLCVQELLLCVQALISLLETRKGLQQRPLQLTPLLPGPFVAADCSGFASAWE